MKNKWIFIVAGCGIAIGLLCAYVLGIRQPVQAAVFAPVASPYASAIYTNGMVESEQSQGENINIFPEVTGRVVKVLAKEGQQVEAGAPLFMIDDSVQRATVDQLRLQAEAQHGMLQELKAQPRKENLAIAQAQLIQAEENLVNARDQYDKRAASYKIDPRSISRDVIDNARDNLEQAGAAALLAARQLELIKAGAWRYDIVNQEKQYQAAQQAYRSAQALSEKYTVRAQEAGVVLAINTALGSYVSPAGTYDSYTQSSLPVVVMGAPQERLEVRCFVDEILISHLPDADHMQAELAVRGSEVKIPLEFVRVQPYVSPKIELSNQRQEKVDLRVLPVVFRFKNSGAVHLYPGQQVDVYIGKK
jgi:HlyD family secretion protein